jgi:GxxExxY protein
MPAAHVLLEEATTRSIIKAFRDVHRGLGYGHRELIYALALEGDLRLLGHDVRREVPVMVYYRGDPLARQNVDMVIDGKVIVEIKAGAKLDPVASAQLLGYLSATDLEVGLILHFGHEPKFHRMVYENRLKRRQSR